LFNDGLTYHSIVMALDIQAASRANEYRDHQYSVGVGATLALAGGYLDGFTFVGHGRLFANAMTGNIVYLGMEVLSSPGHPNFRHLPPLFMFMLGIWAARGAIPTMSRDSREEEPWSPHLIQPVYNATAPRVPLPPFDAGTNLHLPSNFLSQP
jgi:hypothetical protein